jgi:hypothetical protein
MRVQPYGGDPAGDEPSVLPRREAPGWTTSASEQELARLLAADPYIVVDRLARLFRQFEPDRLSGLPLSHRCPIDRIPVRCDVLDLQRDDIAAAQLAVDSEIEHRQIAHAPVHLELGADRPNVLGPQWRLRANQLAPIPGRPSQRFGMSVLMAVHSHSPQLVRMTRMGRSALATRRKCPLQVQTCRANVSALKASVAV